MSLRRIHALWLPALCLLLLLGACTNDDGTNNDNNNEDTQETDVNKPDEDPDTTQISTYNPERLNKQEETEQALMEKYENGTHTLDDPFIKVENHSA